MLKEWKGENSLADDGSIAVKKADKEYCVLTWDRNDCIFETETIT